MKIALVGYGKMGKEIEQILIARGHTISLIIDVNNTADLDADHLRDIDVAIEFTTPQTAYGNIVKCIEAGVPVVCGTTAWLDKLPEVEQLCKAKQGAFFYASNYSIGVNIFFEINRYLAELMNRFGEYDVTIEETHHTQKKDAPSGTAVTLAEGILSNLGRKRKWGVRHHDRPRRAGNRSNPPEHRTRHAHGHLRIRCRFDHDDAHGQKSPGIRPGSRARRRVPAG